ncbi:MAG: Vitamin B12 transporter BtuB [Flavobacterium sp. SCGC AAA160-P02]|nr:MAG: Vitamin B12 transporter BtuB [Flavobacterium sp. SCGC AAA160-P02]
MNIKNSLLIPLTLLINSYNFSQEKKVKLDSIIINSSRISLPFKENSRTITVITSEQIKQSATTNIADLLQQVAGVDIRRRGLNGMQSDVYIRGGSFDQTLLLIDGIKVEDAQTGHHTMNMALPIDVVERIEIIKGPAARVFGQNAFTGAINIVTKKEASKVNSIRVQGGSFQQKNVSGTIGKNFKNTSFIGHASYNTSDGYRYNTDFKNQNYFIKNTFNKNKTPINFIGYYTSRKFGSNGFYASPTATDQYEETETSLIGFSTKITTDKMTFKPRIYWKRNQDMYVFIRDNPSVYRNLHISNKVGAEFHMSYRSKLGITGFGIDLAKVYLQSNNLGDRERTMTNVFLEHQFTLFDDKLDITPGVAATYFSDFKFQAFPGIDLGINLQDHLKLYANIGYTYRIPTYTDLFYSDPTTLGNENLTPEEAISEEIGLKFSKGKLIFSTAVFNRDSNNLIDYVKNNEDDKWQATNIQELNTFGFEINSSYQFSEKNYPQYISIGYTYLTENLKANLFEFSRYSINSLKHHFITTYTSQFFKNLRHTFVYKFADRTLGDSYSVIDLMFTLDVKSFQFSVIGNNIFNTDYTETNLVPMPQSNIMFDVSFRF